MSMNDTPENQKKHSRPLRIVLIIAGSLLLFFTVMIAGINFWLTDERLRSMIAEPLRETAGQEADIQSLSVTFFRTFPRFGIELKGVRIPDSSGEEMILADDLLVSLDLIPLLRNEISVSRLQMTGVFIHYRILPDERSNFDFLLSREPESVGTGAGYTFSVPEIIIRETSLYYTDENTRTELRLNGLEADMAFFYGEHIQTDMALFLESLSFARDGTQWITNLSLSLNQSSVIRSEEELFQILDAELSIRGLALDLSGSVSEWSSGQPLLDLAFNSSSENFGELLRLVPPHFMENVSTIRTDGSLVLEGEISGRVTDDSLPDIGFRLNVSDGFLQYPDLPQGVEEISFNFSFTNDLAFLSHFQAVTADNRIRASGQIENPLSDSAPLHLDLNADIDLGTAALFYPLSNHRIDELGGQLSLSGELSGNLHDPDSFTLSGLLKLEDGMLKFEDVPGRIEDFFFHAEASEERLFIHESGFRSGQNLFTLSGLISNPMSEQSRELDLKSSLRFDLESLRTFYPIDEDTLQMRGLLKSEIHLRGNPQRDDPERLLQQSRITVEGGYLFHIRLNQPIEELVFRAEGDGRRLAISEAGFRSGSNRLSFHGTLLEYLGDNPYADLTFDGLASLSSIAEIYSFEPWIQQLEGDAEMTIRSRGRIQEISTLELDGSLTVNSVSASGDSLFLPVTGLSGELTVTPEQMTLQDFRMFYGSSDIQLEGSVSDYMLFFRESNVNAFNDIYDTNVYPAINGIFKSNHLNFDELIDWDAEKSDDPYPVHLPNLTANTDIEITGITLFGLEIRDLHGTGTLSREKLALNRASARLFDGKATGSMTWNTTLPLATSVAFEGALEGVTAENFLRDTGFLGKNSTLYRYISGELNTRFQYQSKLTPSLDPDISSTKASGSFGMTGVRMRDHPIQRELSRFLNSTEFQTLTLDEWEAVYSIEESVMTLTGMSITSGNLGMQLDGSVHLISGELDYRATLLLPSRFKNGIASIISSQAASALELDDGRLAVPVLISGTIDSPRVGPDTQLIERIIRDRVRDGAEDLLRRLFRN
ncbi:MAG: AsmA family protein [Balneolaceae bacterium]|nr:MAG: AsmA family protein [Balneolaceae bacterium]